MKMTLGLAIVLLSSASFAEDDSWPNYPISAENSVFLASEILEGSSKNISPIAENCQDSKLLNLCGQDRLELLKNFDKKQKDLIDGWMEEIKKSKNLLEIKSSCSEHVEKIQPKINDGLSWIQNLIDNKIVDTQSLRAELLKDFDQKVSAKSDQKKLMVKWKEYCEGNSEPYANTYAEIYLTKMLVNFGHKGKGKEFCEKIVQNDFTWLKNFILSSSAEYLSDQLKKVSKYPWLIKSEIQEGIVERSFVRNQPRYMDGFFEHEEFSKIQNEINGKECEKYSQSENAEEQVCECIKAKIEDELGAKIKKDFESKIIKVEDKIKSIYKKMVDSSILTTSEKQKLIQQFPAPKISLNLFSGALTRASYGYDVMSPPFTSKMYLSPAIIHALTQNPQDSLSEMNFNVLSHELGHHFFTSLIGKDKMKDSLSEKTQEKMQQMSDCLDKTSIDRELLPAYRGNMKIDSEDISILIPKKRSEIGADVFASQVNQMEIDGMKWKRENGAMINCSMIDAGESKESQLRYLLDSHTSPEARIDIITNPPSCASILWKKN